MRRTCRWNEQCQKKVAKKGFVQCCKHRKRFISNASSQTIGAQYGQLPSDLEPSKRRSRKIILQPCLTFCTSNKESDPPALEVKKAIDSGGHCPDHII